MNFDEFFAMSKEIFKEENSNNQLNIDSNEIEASCLFCPYAVDKKHWFSLSLYFRLSLIGRCECMYRD